MSKGKPIRLDAQMQQMICDCLKVGGSRAAAARTCGIAFNTFRKWMDRGKRGHAHLCGGREVGEPIYREFRNAVLAAECYCENFYVEILKRSASYDDIVVKDITNPDGSQRSERTKKHVLNPLVAQYWLERRRASDWGKREVEEIVTLKKELAELKELISKLTPEGEAWKDGAGGTD